MSAQQEESPDGSLEGMDDLEELLDSLSADLAGSMG
jgi:hypothetical protein